jgi:flagellar biosynthetic protein FlhB
MSDDLQDGEKTEDATPRRREEAREQGQVALSNELLTTAVLCAGLGALVLGGGRLASSTGALIEKSVVSLPSLGREELSPSRCTGIFAASLSEMAVPLACLVLPILGGVLVVGYAQVGFRISSKAISWDLGRVDPMKGLRRVFSGRARSSVRCSRASGTSRCAPEAPASSPWPRSRWATSSTSAGSTKTSSR